LGAEKEGERESRVREGCNLLAAFVKIIIRKGKQNKTTSRKKFKKYVLCKINRQDILEYSPS